ncbi:MAG: NifU family protein [Methanosarcinales archaeon]|nr:MAG: NifU family protein [Methanosarcinales archaeon]
MVCVCRSTPCAVATAGVLPPCLVCRGFNADTGIVKVQLAGSCVGCPSSSATLRNGVEGMLTYYIPEVRGIEEVKDVTEKVSDKEFDTLEARLKAAGAE